MGEIHLHFQDCETGWKTLAQLLNGPCGNVLPTAMTKVKDELSYISLLKEYNVQIAKQNCRYFEPQYYVNSKQHHLIKQHLHAETPPYGGDNMFAA